MGRFGSPPLSAFDGTDPNGTWSLYVVDEFQRTMASSWAPEASTSRRRRRPRKTSATCKTAREHEHPARGPNALDSKLHNALDALNALNADDTAGACYWMQSFADLVNSPTGTQPGKKIWSDQAQQLIAAATAIQTQLDC